MNTLDNLKQIKKLDKNKVLESIEMLGEQINQAWQEASQIRIPESYKKVDKVFVCGMGGSALGAHILRSVFFDQLKLPLFIVNDYQLPVSLGSKTLCVVSSYSGSTEESLAALKEARKRGAKIFIITNGGSLADLVESGNLPGYVFSDSFNPSAQPRMGLGYSLGAQLALFRNLGFVKISFSEIEKCLAFVDRLQSHFGVSNLAAKNPAKQLAKSLEKKMVIVVAAEFLAGNAHTLSNQLNETAKVFAAYHLIPELNHHLLEGLTFPKSNQSDLVFLFFESNLYYSRNKVRFSVTENVVAKNKVKYFNYQLVGRSEFEQSLEMLLFGTYLTFYLAILNGVNPAKIPFVDYFKGQLKKYH